MTLFGAGLAPMGSSPAGLGLIVEDSEVKPRLLQKPDGTVGNASLIVEGDFVVDERAREVGSDSTPMKVLLALTTVKDSSAVRGFGLDVTIDTFRPDAQLRVDTAVRAALADLVKSGAISVQSVTLSKVNLTANVLVKWIDLKKPGKIQETSVNVQ